MSRVAHLGGAVALRLLDVDSDRFPAVVERQGALLLGAVVHVGDLAQPDQPAVSLGDDQVARILRRVQPPLEPDRPLVERPLSRPTGAARF